MGYRDCSLHLDCERRRGGGGREKYGRDKDRDRLLKKNLHDLSHNGSWPWGICKTEQGVCVWLSSAAVNLLLYNRRARAEREEKTGGRLVPLSL